MEVEVRAANEPDEGCAAQGPRALCSAAATVPVSKEDTEVRPPQTGEQPRVIDIQAELFSPDLRCAFRLRGQGDRWWQAQTADDWAVAFVLGDLFDFDLTRGHRIHG
jgi:hypothetical protein